MEIEVIKFISERIVYLGFAILVLYLLLKYKIEWLRSIRSLITVMVGSTFCYLAMISKVDPKDLMLIVSLVFNFYFLVKERKDKLIEEEK